MKKEAGKDTFETFMSKVENDSLYRKAITSQSRYFQVKARELLRSNPKSIRHQREYYTNMIKEQGGQEGAECSQGERKMFCWILMCYLYLHKLTVSALNDHDWSNLSQLSTGRSIPIIKYLSHLFLNQAKRPTWTDQEDKILRKILAEQKKYETVGEWSNVARQLFLRGDMTMYKSGKNCRQRWFNHVDPKINKQWTDAEDLKLMNAVVENGKKWAKIIPILDGSKSEHMIKNRFNGLIKKKQNQYERESREEKLVEMVIEELIMKIQEHENEKKREKEKEKEKEKQKEKGTQKQSNNRTKEVKELSENIRILRSNTVKSNLSLESPAAQNQPTLLTSQFFQQKFQTQFNNGFMEASQYFKEQEIEPANHGELRLNESMRMPLRSPLPPTPLPLTEQQSSFLGRSGAFLANL